MLLPASGCSGERAGGADAEAELSERGGCADAIAGEMGSIEEQLVPLQQFWAKILARTRSQLGDDFNAILKVRLSQLPMEITHAHYRVAARRSETPTCSCRLRSRPQSSCGALWVSGWSVGWENDVTVRADGGMAVLYGGDRGHVCAG